MESYSRNPKNPFSSYYSQGQLESLTSPYNQPYVGINKRQLDFVQRNGLENKVLTSRNLPDPMTSKTALPITIENASYHRLSRDVDRIPSFAQEGQLILPDTGKDYTIFQYKGANDYIIQPKSMLQRGSMCVSELFCKKAKFNVIAQLIDNCILDQKRNNTANKSVTDTLKEFKKRINMSKNLHEREFKTRGQLQSDKIHKASIKMSVKKRKKKLFNPLDLQEDKQIQEPIMEEIASTQSPSPPPAPPALHRYSTLTPSPRPLRSPVRSRSSAWKLRMDSRLLEELDDNLQSKQPLPYSRQQTGSKIGTRPGTRDGRSGGGTRPGTASIGAGQAKRVEVMRKKSMKVLTVKDTDSLIRQKPKETRIEQNIYIRLQKQLQKSKNNENGRNALKAYIDSCNNDAIPSCEPFRDYKPPNQKLQQKKDRDSKRNSMVTLFKSLIAPLGDGHNKDLEKVRLDNESSTDSSTTTPVRQRSLVRSKSVLGHPNLTPRFSLNLSEIQEKTNPIPAPLEQLGQKKKFMRFRTDRSGISLKSYKSMNSMKSVSTQSKVQSIMSKCKDAISIK